MRKFQHGDESAFNDLVRRYQQQIYGVARRLLGNHEETQDVSQDIFIKAYSSLNAFRAESNFSTWLYRIAVNLSLNVLRKRKLRQIMSLEAVGLSIRSKSLGADEQVEKQELLSLLNQAIDKLPRRQKLVFALRYDQNLPHEEIAKILDRDVGTIKANYHHAIRKLQKAVKS
ncbi:MAG TPA: sigma-70 family RNA polymerase sigma factor [bacterium]